MADPKAKTSIKIGVDERPAVEGLKRLVRAFRRNATSINQSLELVQKAWGAVVRIVSGLTSAIKDLAAASAVQEAAERKLISALTLRGQMTDAVWASTQKLNSEIQQSIGVGDELMLSIQASMVAMGIQGDQLAAATRATIGLADVIGDAGSKGSLTTASRLVARALQGNTKSLRGYGLSATDAADATKELEALYQIAASRSGTLATKVQILEANLGDFKETMGVAFTKSAALNGILEALRISSLEWIDVFKSPEGLQIVDNFFKAIAGMAASALNAFLGVRRAVDDLFVFLGQRGTALVELGALLGQAVASPLSVMANRDKIKEALAQAIKGGAIEAAKDGPVINALQNLADNMTAVAAGQLGTPAGTAVSKMVRKKKAPAKELGTAEPDPEAFIFSMDAINADVLAARRQDLAVGTKGILAEIQGFTRGWSEAADETEALAQRQEATFRQIGDTIASGLASTLIGGIEAVVDGSASILDAIGGMLGGLLKQLGQMLIQLGTAALLASALGWIPVFRPFVGEPTVGAGLALAAIAGGAALVAAGSALSSSGAGSSARSPGAARSSAPGRGSSSSPRPSSQAPAGFNPYRGGATPSGETTINVHLGRAAVIGTPREVGRAVHLALQEYRPLVPAGVR